MGANLDLIERAVVLQIAVVDALTYRTCNGFVCLTAHVFHPPFLDYSSSIACFVLETPSKRIQKAGENACLCIIGFWKFFLQSPVQPERIG